MEFKGTKGEWLLDYYGNKGGVIDIIVDVNEAENGNKSKPLLPAVSYDKEIKVISINKISEKQKKDYTELVLKQTKSF